MSSVISRFQRGAAAPERPSLDMLRCRGEHAALVLEIVSSLAVIAIAIVIAVEGTAWLGTYPALEKHVGWVRVALIGSILALPATVFGRHLQIHAARKAGVRVSKQQFSELHDALLRACGTLGVERIPGLYVGRIEAPAAAYSLWNGQSVIVVNSDLFDIEWRHGIDWLSFVVAGALGAIRLGHTRWWVELLTFYSTRIPGLRTPLLLRWAFSRDRCAAFAVPDGIRGLLVEAVGKHAASNVAIGPFLSEVEPARGLWDFAATFKRKAPLLTDRVRALYEAGFFDRARDLQRGDEGTPHV